MRLPGGLSQPCPAWRVMVVCAMHGVARMTIKLMCGSKSCTQLDATCTINAAM